MLTDHALRHHVLVLSFITLVFSAGCVKVGSQPATQTQTQASPPSSGQLVTTHPKPQPEFISLEKPATVEYATLTIGSQSYRLDQSGHGEIGDQVATFLYQQDAIADEAGGTAPPLAAVVINGDDVRAVVNRFGVTAQLRIQKVVKKKSQVVVDEYVYSIWGQLTDGTKVFLVYPTSMDGMGNSWTRIDEVNNSIVVSGSLGTRTYNQLFELFRQRPDLDQVVLRNIGGSIHDEVNMQTGRLIRRAEVMTYVPHGSTIASGGVDLYCAGLQRLIEPGAELLVHSWGGFVDGGIVSAHELPRNHPGHRSQLVYFTEMLGNSIGSEFYWFTINSAPFGEELHQMSAEEIARYRLETVTNQ